MSAINCLKFADISALFFPCLSSSALRHAIFTRQGGVSPEPYNSLNVGLHVGDHPENIRENRARIKKASELPMLASAKQIHGDKVMVVTKPLSADYEFEGYDALITNLAGIGLMVQQADCQAVLLFDPVRRAIGNIHVGWRGSKANIIQKTIAAMRKMYGTNPQELRAGISPSLGPCCAEFVNFKEELPTRFQTYQVRPHYFDFWAISRDQLTTSGVKPEHIDIAGICTVCDHRFFSYRREQTTGRFGSVIGLR